MSKSLELLPKIPPEVDIPLVFERNITRAIKTFYLKPKGEYPLKSKLFTKSNIYWLIRSITKTAIVAANRKEGRPESIGRSLSKSALGYIAEIFVASASQSIFREEFAVSLSSFKRDLTPGVDLRFRQKNTGRRLFFDLYIGLSPREFSKKINRVHKIRGGFILPLCLGPKPELPHFTNKILEDYPGIELKKLKELLAIQVWQAALTGEFAPDIFPSPWNEVVKNRILAGYLIRSKFGKHFAPVPAFEKMIKQT